MENISACLSYCIAVALCSYSFELTNILVAFTFWRIQGLSWVSQVLKLKLSWYG